MKGKIRLLAVAPSLGRGGAEMHLLRLLNHFDRERIRPAVAVAEGGGSYEAQLARDVPVHTLVPGRARSSTGCLVRSLLPLRRLVKRERPDVVFSILGATNVAALLALWGLDQRPKVVVGVQNNLSRKYRQNGGAIFGPAMLFLTRRTYGRADRVVALSEGVAGNLRTLVPAVRPGRVDVVYNAGVDEALYEKAREALPPEERPGPSPGEGGPLIAACGRLTEQKGFPHLIEALARLRRASIPARLWIIGEGEDRKALEAQARRLGVAEALWMPGFKDNPYRYMAAADAFALSSLWEGFGNVVAEAMACGTPVVATDCPYGPGEIVEDGTSGLLVPPSDPGALAGALRRVLEDDALRRRLAEGGTQRARDFDAATITRAYEEVFDDVLH